MTFQEIDTKTPNRELHEGVGGNGQTIYLVVTLGGHDGKRWMHREQFATRAEAERWMEYT